MTIGDPDMIIDLDPPDPEPVETAAGTAAEVGAATAEAVADTAEAVAQAVAGVVTAETYSNESDRAWQTTISTQLAELTAKVDTLATRPEPEPSETVAVDSEPVTEATVVVEAPAPGDAETQPTRKRRKAWRKS